MSEHTPGPWLMACDEEGVYQPKPSAKYDTLCCVESPSYDAIDIIAKRESWDGDPLPDARLIKEAPALLATLEELFALVQGECPRLLNEDSDGDVNLYFRVTETISKAKGAT